MASQIGEAVIKLTFDGSSVKASLNKVESTVESSGTSSGTAWGNAWSVAAGNLVAKGISKIASVISNSLDKAIKRVDTINNFPKVMAAMGYESEEASESIELMSDRLMGLPTTLDESITNVQRLTATMGNLNKGMVNATSVGLALNDMFLAGGHGQEAASAAMEQYNQMLAAGRPDMQSWRTLLNTASGQMDELAKTILGATANQQDLYTALQKGTVTFDQMNEAIVKLDKEGGNGFASFEEQARTMTGGIGTAITNLYNRLNQAIAKIIQAIGPEKIYETIENISKSFSGLADIIINIVVFLGQNQWILDTIMAFFVGLLAMGIATRIANFFTMLSAFAATNPVLLAIGAISAALFLLITHIEDVGNFFKGLWDGVVEGAQNVWNFITGIFSGLANFFGNIFSNAWNAVKNVFSTGGKIFMGIVDGITQAFRAIVNAIITGINHVVALPFNAINGFLSFLKSIDILGIKPFGWVGTIDVPQIPLLAQGGYANGATGAVIGESGAEVVLPLEQNTGNWAGLLASTLAEEMGAQGKGREINVYMNNNINNRLDAEEIGSLMIQSIRRAA